MISEPCLLFGGSDVNGPLVKTISVPEGARYRWHLIRHLTVADWKTKQRWNKHTSEQSWIRAAQTDCSGYESHPIGDLVRSHHN